MGSTPVPEDNPTPTPAEPPAEDTPASPPEFPDGVGFKNHSNVAFKGTPDNADNDYRIADVAVNWIADLLNWTISKSGPIPPSHADPLCTSLLTLVHNLSDLGVLKDYATWDELGVRSSELGAIASDLVSIPSVAAFTPAPEDVQTARGSQPTPVPPPPKGKKDKGKGKASAPTPAPPPRPHSLPTPPHPTQTCCGERGCGYVLGPRYQQTEDRPTSG